MGNLLQPSFSKGEVNPEVFGRVDTASYKLGLSIARNMIVRTFGSIQNRAGLQHVNLATSQTSKSRLRRFRFNTGDVYVLEFSNLTMRVIQDDAFLLESPKTITVITQSTTNAFTIPSHGFSAGDDFEVTGVVGMTRVNGRRFKVGNVINGDNLTAFDIIQNQTLDTSGYAAYVSGGTASRVYTLATPYVSADLATLKFTQSADVVTVTHPNYPEARLARIAPTNWTLTNPSFAPQTATVTGVAVTPNTTGTTIAGYTVTAIDATSGEEGLPAVPVVISNGNATANNTITWSAGTNVSLYSVYKAVNGVYGFIGDTPALTFTDANFAPALSTTPPNAANPFTGAGFYPAASGYYQQRQVRGGSLNLPDTAYYSQIGNFYNMSKSVPSAASDAMTVAMTAREVNQIRFFVPGKDLLVFTAGAEWRVNSSGQGFSAETISQTPQSSWGCSHLEPIVIGLTTIFVPQNQITVRSFTYTYISDNYTGADLSLVSGHLFGSPVQGVPQTLTAWAFGSIPDPCIFGVRSDGTATCLTYQEDQQVNAWTRWDTQGVFETVEVIRPNLATPDDMPYFALTRTVDGRQLRTIERLHSRRFSDVRDCFFVDAGLSYDVPTAISDIVCQYPCAVETAMPHGLSNGDLIDIYDIVWVANVDDLDNETQPNQLNTQRFQVSVGNANILYLTDMDGNVVDGTGFNAYFSGGTIRTPTQTVIGLDHLEGCNVVALADGNFVNSMTVQDGAISIPFLASRIHVGLKYISDVQTLDLEAPQGSIQGLWKQIPYVTVRFNQSRGLFAGPDPTNLTELKQRQYEAWGDPTALLTGDAVVTVPENWGPSAKIFLRQRYPLPMDILAIIPELDVEG